MVKNICPIDIGNATIITREPATGSPLTIFRYEELFDFFSEEPLSIAVKKEKNDKKRLFECILRIRIWKPKGNCVSWSIYSEERELFEDFIIRKVNWNLDKDTEFAKKQLKVKNKELWKKAWKETLDMWPSIEMRNIYVPLPQSDDVICSIHNFDLEIEDGFTLHKSDRQAGEWRELEIKRKLDWGQIHLVWGPEKRNGSLEDKIQKLVSELDFIINGTNAENVFEMVLNYSMKPEDYKNSLKGHNQ